MGPSARCLCRLWRSRTRFGNGMLAVGGIGRRNRKPNAPETPSRRGGNASNILDMGIFPAVPA